MRHKPYRVITKKVSLPMDLVGRVELRLPTNASNTAPAYSAWSQLLESLLRDWLDRAEATEPEPKPVEPVPEGA